MNLNIKSGTVGYNNKILVSDGMFSLGRSNMVNTSVPINRAPIMHTSKISIVHAPAKHTSTIMHEDEKIALVLALTFENQTRWLIRRSGMRGMFLCSLRHDDLMVVKGKAFHTYQVALMFCLTSIESYSFLTKVL